MQYSRLAFTREQDRPIAIAGLEKRLIHSFGARGGFGVFDDAGAAGMLRRSLLWRRRADEASSDLINFRGIDRTATGMPPPPTWSWMAHRGGIEYLDPPFPPVGEVAWEEVEIRSPWRSGMGDVWHSADEAGLAELSAMARDFDIKGMQGEDARIVFDVPNKTEGPGPALRCVVLGRLSTPTQNLQKRRHYVMIVAPNTSQVARGGEVYERVGVGFMPGKLINLTQAAIPIKIR
jgi:hypothetical protein